MGRRLSENAILYNNVSKLQVTILPLFYRDGKDLADRLAWLNRSRNLLFCFSRRFCSFTRLSCYKHGLQRYPTDNLSPSLQLVMNFLQVMCGVLSNFLFAWIYTPFFTLYKLIFSIKKKRKNKQINLLKQKKLALFFLRAEIRLLASRLSQILFMIDFFWPSWPF